MTSSATVGPVLRYPGGKQRLLRVLSPFLPVKDEIEGRYVEPFVGGASVFLHLSPRRALVADANPELIELYRGLRADPVAVWERYASYGSRKRDYHRVRAVDPSGLSLTEQAARLLYLNRTCFKGNWRQNSKGQFNIGYGGQSRRWVLSEAYLCGVAGALSRAELRCSDFEDVIDECAEGDFVFLDPPYRRGESELSNDHYAFRRFTFGDQERLAAALTRATGRGVSWIMTNSSHSDVLALYNGCPVFHISRSSRSVSSGEAIISSKG